MLCSDGVTPGVEVLVLVGRDVGVSSAKALSVAVGCNVGLSKGVIVGCNSNTEGEGDIDGATGCLTILQADITLKPSQAASNDTHGVRWLLLIIRLFFPKFSFYNILVIDRLTARAGRSTG